MGHKPLQATVQLFLQATEGNAEPVFDFVLKRVDVFTRDELQVSHDREIERYRIQHVVTEDLQ